MSNDPSLVAEALDALALFHTEKAARFTAFPEMHAYHTQAAEDITAAVTLLRTIPDLTEKAWMYDDLCE